MPLDRAFNLCHSDGSIGSAFLNNGIAGTTPADGKAAYGVFVAGQHNRISDNHITGVGAPTEWSISTTDVTTSCFDNYLRAMNGTVNCDAELGNY